MAQVGRWPLIEGNTTAAADATVLQDWRRDTSPFYAVVLLLENPAVEQRRRLVRRALHPWCRATTPDQAHITLAVCGRVAPTGLAESRHPVAIGGADSFTSAAFLAAAGPRLADLRHEVLRSVPQEVNPGPTWVPHVTVGTYRWPLPAAHVARRLAGLRALPRLAVVGRLTVVSVDKGGSSRLRCDA